MPTEPSAAALKTADRLLQRCDELAAISSLPDAIRRVYLSREHHQANELVSDWMHQAGMQTRIDAAGSVCGRYAGTAQAQQTLVIGSHLDTIVDAGRYDGILGVLMGIEVVAALNRDGVRLPFAIEVIGFAEEEGVRFGTTLMTSRAFAGTWDTAWAELVDEEGINLAAALQAFDLDPAAIHSAARAKEDLLGYLEVHIEQGPVLESLEAPLGVVTAIAGARRAEITLTGLAGHAGTTPMNLRRDALVVAAHAIGSLESLAVQQDAMGTVGQIHCEPGGVNVIPGQVVFSVDVRAAEDVRRDRVMDEFVAGLERSGAQRGVGVAIEHTHSASAVNCATDLQQAFADAVASLGLTPHRLPSGAGHDAMAVADVCPVGMLFLRCTDGISHNPAEAVTRPDVAWAYAALAQTVTDLGRKLGA